MNGDLEFALDGIKDVLERIRENGAIDEELRGLKMALEGIGRNVDRLGNHSSEAAISIGRIKEDVFDIKFAAEHFEKSLDRAAGGLRPGIVKPSAVGRWELFAIFVVLLVHVIHRW